MTVGELIEKLDTLPKNAVILIDFHPELDLNDISRVQLTGFDEYNPVVNLITNTLTQGELNEKE